MCNFKVLINAKKNQKLPDLSSSKYDTWTPRNIDCELTIRDTVSESFTVFSHWTVHTVRLWAPSCYIVVGPITTGNRVLGGQTVKTYVQVNHT